jgi:hypothetical protein
MDKEQTAPRGLEHSKIIAEAAKETLEPLGIFQKGRSRSWIDDRGWWIVNIEFQPSGNSKGSYLNVAAMWLWDENDFFTFDFGNDVGGRIAGFVEYVDEKQFTPEALRLSLLAKLFRSTMLLFTCQPRQGVTTVPGRNWLLRLLWDMPERRSEHDGSSKASNVRNRSMTGNTSSKKEPEDSLKV